MSAWREHVTACEHTLSAEQMAAHRHYLADATTIVRALGDMIARHDGRSHAAGGHFSSEEIAVLVRARAILDAASTPMVLLRQAPPPAPVILGGAA